MTQTAELDRGEYEEARENVESFDSHVVVGVNDESGDALMVDDGHHGWTLPAFAFETGADWEAIGREDVEEILGVGVEIQATERVRRRARKFAEAY